MRISQPGPEGRAHPASWRLWLLIGGTALVLTLLVLPLGAAQGTTLGHSRFLADVGAGAVRAVTIDPAGQVTGTLATWQPFTTTIPVALDDLALRRPGRFGREVHIPLPNRAERGAILAAHACGKHLGPRDGLVADELSAGTTRPSG